MSIARAGAAASAEAWDVPHPPDVRLIGPGPDLGDAEQAAAAFLTALGVDLDDQSRRDSPGRMARAYAELFAPRPFDLTTFANDEGFDGLVQARSIPVRSVCEHHFLPFAGVAHVGYIPAEQIVGLSKLARVVEHFASRPQVQERLTTQVADFLDRQLRPAGVAVVVRAEHTCMTLRGVAALGSDTVTSVFRGELSGGDYRREFMSLTSAD
jgi:GTP cyclohydrolase I